VCVYVYVCVCVYVYVCACVCVCVCAAGDVWKLSLGERQPKWVRMSALSEASPQPRAAHSANMLNGACVCIFVLVCVCT